MELRIPGRRQTFNHGNFRCAVLVAPGFFPVHHVDDTLFRRSLTDRLLLETESAKDEACRASDDFQILAEVRGEISRKRSRTRHAVDFVEPLPTAYNRTVPSRRPTSRCNSTGCCRDCICRGTADFWGQLGRWPQCRAALRRRLGSRGRSVASSCTVPSQRPSGTG